MRPNKTYKICVVKETINKMKRHSLDWEKIFAANTNGKGLTYKYTNSSYNSIKK